MLERPDFADDLADHKVTAGIEFGMPSLHRLDMFGMRPPGFQRFLRGEAKQADFLAVDGLVRLDRLEAGKLAHEVVHALAETAIFVDVGAIPQLQVPNNDHFADHLFPSVIEATPLRRRRAGNFLKQFAIYRASVTPRIRNADSQDFQRNWFCSKWQAAASPGVPAC